jgi:predicted  nucleic acid-binding Zn-ribbon protein
MKRANLLIVAVALLVAYGCSGSNPASDSSSKTVRKETTLEKVRDNSATALSNVIDPSKQTREEYVKAVRKEIDGLESRIDALQTKAGEMTEGTRRAWEKRTKELEERREDLQNKLSMIMDSADDAWRETAKGLEQARQDLSASLDKAETEFTNELQKGQGGGTS